MKRPLRIAVLASPLVLALACTHEGYRTRSYNPRSAQAYAPQSARRVVAGRLVNMTSRTITVAEPDGDRRTLWLDPRTTVTVDGRAANLDDLRPGEDVRAAYDVGPDGHRVAVGIATGGERSRGDAYGARRDPR